MSRRKKQKAAEKRVFPFPLEAGRKAPGFCGYRVKTPMGQLSEPMRECFWTLPHGKTFLTERERTGYLTKTKLERIANESE